MLLVGIPLARSRTPHYFYTVVRGYADSLHCGRAWRVVLTWALVVPVFVQSLFFLYALHESQMAFTFGCRRRKSTEILEQGVVVLLEGLHFCSMVSNRTLEFGVEVRAVTWSVTHFNGVKRIRIVFGRGTVRTDGRRASTAKTACEQGSYSGTCAKDV
jgi:hypothetical protein